MEAMIAYLHNDSNHVEWAQAANTGETIQAYLSCTGLTTARFDWALWACHDQGAATAIAGHVMTPQRCPIAAATELPNAKAKDQHQTHAFARGSLW